MMFAPKFKQCNAKPTVIKPTPNLAGSFEQIQICAASQMEIRKQNNEKMHIL